MKTKDYTTFFSVDQSPEKVLAAITTFVGGGQKKLTVVPTNSVLSLGSTTKTFTAVPRGGPTS